MLRGFYTAASGMVTQQRKQEMLTNNMTNAKTPGYKADQSSSRSFPELLISSQQDMKIPGTDRNKTTTNELGSLATGVYMQETLPNISQGDMQETNRKTDMALLNQNIPDNAAILFDVQTEEGQRYTRNGHFTIDANNQLVTQQGYRVLDTNGEAITLPADGDFSVRDDGTITANDQNIAQINIAFANDAGNLVKEGNGLFRADGVDALPSAIGNDNVTYNVQQGFLERSNVKMEETMTDMMNTYRMFETNQKVVQAYDQSMSKAVNDVGKLR